MSAYNTLKNNHDLASTKYDFEDQVPVCPNNITEGEMNFQQQLNDFFSNKMAIDYIPKVSHDDGPSMIIYIGDYYTGDDKFSSNDKSSGGGSSCVDGCSSDDDDDDMGEDDSILSDPTIANIMGIKEFLEPISTADREVQQKFNQYIVEEKYIIKLVALLLSCEKSRSHLDCCSSNIVNELLKNSNFVGYLGILKYDPTLKEGKAQYRHMSHRVNKFKEVVPIDDPHTTKLINQIIRLQFPKDNVHSDTLGDAESLLTVMIKVKILELVQDIVYDRQLVKDLSDALKNRSEPTRRRNDVLLIVCQLCVMAKKTTIDVYRKLCPAGLFDLLEFAFVTFDAQVKQAGIEIMQMAMKTSPRLILTQIVEQATRRDSKVFLDAFLNQVILERNINSLSQLVDAIQALLDVNPEKSARTTSNSFLHGGNAADNDSDRSDASAEAFLDLFYTQYFATLAEPLLALTNDSTSLDRPTSALREKICKIIMFLIQQHPSRLKILLTSSGLTEKIAILFKNNARRRSEENAALKFFRTYMNLGDDYFIRLLVRTRVIHIVIALPQNNKSSRNAINSACLEFFEHIRKNNIKLMVFQCGAIHNETMEGLS
ncbi:Platinum sensitivity protein [Haplosporangium gracile]|nr:Platinum sensitivity protein [Haplosporangium gracile]